MIDEIKEIKDKKNWEEFLRGCKEKTFLGSWNWGEFQRKLNNKVWRLGVFKKGKLSATAQVIKTEAKRGTFLFVPHGPNLRDSSTKIRNKTLSSLLEFLKKVAEKEKASFVRFSPIWERKEENIDVFKSLDFKRAPIHVHPELTWEIDISRQKKDILMNMRKNTRYEIKKAEKNKDLKIEKSNKKEDIKIFNNLYEKTAKRHDFVPFSLDYLKKEYESFILDDQILTFHARYKKEVVSSAIIIFWQRMAFYHHGASSMKYPKVPSSRLLQWEAIKEAKRRNCELYNFWGIADIPLREVKKKKHPWAGLTIFKRGFGGERKEYVPTQDFILSSKYWLNFLIEKARKIKRGF